MKPTIAADEMFPEGVSPYMDLEEPSRVGPTFTNPFGPKRGLYDQRLYAERLEAMAELYPDEFLDDMSAGGTSNLLMDLAASDKAVHVDFFNDFEDLFDDDDLQ